MLAAHQKEGTAILRRSLVSLVCAAAVVGATACSPTSAPRRPAATHTRHTICPPSWTSYLHDASNSSDNTCDTAISASSVDGLRPAWEKAELVGVTGVPVVSHGTVYFGDETGTEWAVRSTDGAVIWKTHLGAGVIGSADLVGDAAYVAAGADLYRLNRMTGAVVWKEVTNPSPFAQINASPVVVRNEVVVGTASFEVVIKSSTYTFQGSIGAFDTATGRRLWNFVTTANNSSSGAGEGIWSTAAVDPALGVLYVGTGQNLAPPSGRLEDSILAINDTTGKLVWSMQATKDDIFSAGYPDGFDYDFGASPNLFKAGGRELVGDGDKGGKYYAVDARTGTVVWQRRLAPGGPFGGVLGSGSLIAGRLVMSVNVGSRTTKATTNACDVVALDPATGAVVWQDHLTGDVFGPVTGSSGVAFVGTTAGRYYGLDAATGRILWRATAPAQVGGGASVVGRQLFWGYGYTLFSGPGKGGIIAFSLPGARH